MRLLEVLSNGDTRLTEKFLDNVVPPYAILSHTWGSQEVTYEDMVKGLGKDKTGYEKIKFCSEQAAKDGLQYIWVDSCAIDKSSSADLQESITSMFRWYKRAAKCYVYLSDVSTRKRKETDDDLQDNWERAFRESRWFTRAWTLQELLAPTFVQFFSKEGRRLGDKQSLEQKIHEITGIPISALSGSALSLFSIDQRMDWAENRKTTREEDWAYSLMGIFDISMLVNYGEGRASAVRRLRKEIEDASQDKECLRHLYVTNPRADKIRIEETKGGLIQDSYRWILENSDFKQWRKNQQSNLLWIKGDPGKGKTMVPYFDARKREKGSFLVIRNDTIYFVHQSAKDYLLDNASDDIFQSGKGEINYEIFSRSLEVLSRTLRRDIYGLRSLGCPIEMVKKPNPDPFMASGYPCIYWVDHLRDWVVDCHTDQIVHLQDGGIVDMFMRNKFLYWLEALSLCGSMSKGLVAMARLEALTKEITSGSSLIELVQDARRFVMYNKQVIETSPLQAYVSALLFSPACSLIRHCFQKEEPQWIKIMPAMRETWGACLQTLEGHRKPVKLVAFSQDSKQLASASSDGTIKVWDTSSGQCLLTFECCKTITSFAFSCISAELMSVSVDGTVKVWNVSSGECLQTLKAQSGKLVGPVVFSHDLTQFGLASQRRSVQVWDIRNGKCVKTLDGFCDSAGPLIFSRDSTKLASSLQGGTIKVWDIYSRQCLLTLTAHSDQVVDSLFFSHNSTQLASVTRNRTWHGQGFDQMVKIWDLSSGDCLQTFTGFRGRVFSIAFSHNLNHLVLIKQAGIVKILDSSSGKCLQVLKNKTSWISSSALSYGPNPTQVALASRKEVKVWDIDSGRCLQTFKGHESWINLVTFSSNAALIASESGGIFKVWDIDSGQCLQTLKSHSCSVNAVLFSQDSTLLVSASEGSIKVWNIDSGEFLKALENHSVSFNSVTFSQDTGLLLSEVSSPQIEIWDLSKIWDLSNSQCLRTLKGHSSSIISMIFSHDSARLASASKSTVKIWNIDSGDCVQTIERSEYEIFEGAITSDLKLLALAKGEAVQVWDTESGECLQKLEAHNGSSVTSIAFSHDSVRLASVLYGTIYLWNVGSGELLQTLEGHNTLINSIAFSNESTRLISASMDCTVKIWDVGSGKYPPMLTPLPEYHSELIRAVVFSYDSRQLASASNDKTIKLWDVNDGACLWTLKGHSNMVSAIAFSYDSTQLISGSTDGAIMVWNTRSGECLWILKGHSDVIRSIAIPHKGTLFASVSLDSTVKVWDLVNGTNLHTFESLEDHINEVAFSHDLAKLALALEDYTISIWDANNGESLQKLKGHSGVASSVAFTYDSTRLASSANGTVRIWDVSSGECLQIINIGTSLHNISFNNSGSYLHTDNGTFAVDIPLASNTTTDQIERQNPKCLGVGLSPTGDWITYNSEKLVWVPSEYRQSYSAVSGRTIGIGVGSGMIWMCNLQDTSHES